MKNFHSTNCDPLHITRILYMYIPQPLISIKSKDAFQSV